MGVIFVTRSEHEAAGAELLSAEPRLALRSHLAEETQPHLQAQATIKTSTLPTSRAAWRAAPATITPAPPSAAVWTRPQAVSLVWITATLSGRIWWDSD